MRISHTNKPHLFITMGDPSGIGPEIVTKALAREENFNDVVVSIVGDSGIIEHASSEFCNKQFETHNLSDGSSGVVLDENCINIIDPGEPLENILSGTPTTKGAEKALRSIDTALSILINSFDSSKAALVTAPVSKADIADISPGFTGHTEYLQKAYGSDFVTMVLTGEQLCVIPVTRHISIKEVPVMLNKEIIVKTLKQVADNTLRICGKEKAVIGVCALNPHGGEGGKIGNEEADIIAPAVLEAKKFYSDIIGPIPADVIFYSALKGKVDIVLGMYHDQCLSPYKMIDFDNGVNMTLGLGHTRTSPSHGTAFDIAGKGIASSVSMENAIEYALRGIL